MTIDGHGCARRSGRGSAVPTVAVSLLVGLLLVGTSPPAHAAQPLQETAVPVPTAVPAPDRSEQCAADGRACILYVEEELRSWEEAYGCDHRAVFATVYRLLTTELRHALEDTPEAFDDPAGLGWEALHLYEQYEQVARAADAGEELPAAWRPAMATAAAGDWTAAHDVLLALAAQLRHDLPRSVLATGLVTPTGTSRSDDQDRLDALLTAAHPAILAEVARRYDPAIAGLGAPDGIADPTAATAPVERWRASSWQAAVQLHDADATGLVQPAQDTLGVGVGAWAAELAWAEVPGHRAVRDAHCTATAEADAVAAEVAADEAAAAAVLPSVGSAAVPAPVEGGLPPVANAVRADELAATGGGGALLGALALAVAVAVRRRGRRDVLHG